ncbi:MAG TPA: DUF2303 family protein [Burkholderiaceae bacterium]|nr:DUF2303 family protein [Burkholderiaceae bacterium]
MNAQLESLETENLAQSLAREMKAPHPLKSPDDDIQRHIALPPGWTMARLDDEQMLTQPRRVKGTVILNDADSFVAYVARHKPAGADTRTVWCTADFQRGVLSLQAILNDNEAGGVEAHWRDHRATFSPELSAEWERWKGQDRKPFTQVEFATFIEENGKDIASVVGLPTSAQMLELALNMEAMQDVRFKSAIRLQNGGVQLQFVQDDDAQTLARMQLFERFAIGIPVFWNGEAYRIDARLRYRVRDGKVSFWFELLRPDLVFESSARTLIEQIRKNTTEVPFFFGTGGVW